MLLAVGFLLREAVVILHPDISPELLLPQGQVHRSIGEHPLCMCPVLLQDYMARSTGCGSWVRCNGQEEALEWALGGHAAILVSHSGVSWRP